MFDAFKEGIRRFLDGGDQALARKTETGIGPIDEEKLWVNMAKQMIVCVKSGGFYYQIEETPPPFLDVLFGTHCEVAVTDEERNCYEVGLSSFHYPGDRGESQVLQVKQKGYASHIFVTVAFRSNVSTIRLSQDSSVRNHKWISSYPRKLDLSEQLQLLSKLGMVTVDETKTLELFNERRQRDGRSVVWIRDMPLLPSILGGDGGL